MTMIVGSSLLAAALIVILILVRKPSADAATGAAKAQNAFIGKSTVLSEPILAGRGKIRIGGRELTVDGPDLDAGTPVKIVAAGSGRLFVEPEGSLSQSTLPKAGTFGG